MAWQLPERMVGRVERRRWGRAAIMIQVEMEPGEVWADLAGKPFSRVGEWAWVGRVDRDDPEARRQMRETVRRVVEEAKTS